MNQNEKAESILHDTRLLLKKYRQVKWALEVASKTALHELRAKTGDPLDTYLHAAVFAGADISNTSLERRAQSMERSRKMISLIDESALFVRDNHPRGEMYYQILYLYYFSPKAMTVEEIVRQMEENGNPVCKATLRKYRNEAVTVVGEVLWGYDDRQTAAILTEIIKDQ